MHVARSVAFGIAAGGIWSIVPGTFSELFRPTGQAITVVLAGVITGVLISLTLSVLLEISGKIITAFLGILALPLSSFVFGVALSTVQLLVKLTSGISYRMVEDGFHPIRAGVIAATYSSMNVFALVLAPLTVFTTFLLRGAMRADERPASSR